MCESVRICENVCECVQIVDFQCFRMEAPRDTPGVMVRSTLLRRQHLGGPSGETEQERVCDCAQNASMFMGDPQVCECVSV